MENSKSFQAPYKHFTLFNLHDHVLNGNVCLVMKLTEAGRGLKHARGLEMFIVSDRGLLPSAVYLSTEQSQQFWTQQFPFSVYHLMIYFSIWSVYLCIQHLRFVISCFVLTFGYLFNATQFEISLTSLPVLIPPVWLSTMSWMVSPVPHYSCHVGLLGKCYLAKLTVTLH